MSLPLLEGLDLTLKARKESQKDKTWELYLVIQPTDGEKLKPFEEWYDDLTRPISNKSKEEMLADYAKIQKSVKNKAQN